MIKMDFSGKQFPKEVIVMVVRWYLSYGISYRNVEELIQDWNIGLDHTTVYRWVVEYSPHLQDKVRKYLNRDFKRSWRLDETYVKVKDKWCYLYRMVDKDGNTINFHLSETRDHQAALICIVSDLGTALF